MGQAISECSPHLVGKTVPLTSGEAMKEAEKISTHLQTCRHKALASLFLCASEEYFKMNQERLLLVETEDKEEQEEIKNQANDHSINNCNSVLESVAAARFSLPDALDAFPRNKYWDRDYDNSLAPTATAVVKNRNLDEFTRTRFERSQQLLEDFPPEKWVNNGPIGILTLNSSITLDDKTALAIEFGDQRPWIRALCSGDVFAGNVHETLGSTWHSGRGHDSTAGGNFPYNNKLNFKTAQTIFNYITQCNGYSFRHRDHGLNIVASLDTRIEAVLKLVLKGKQNSIDLLDLMCVVADERFQRRGYRPPPRVRSKNAKDPLHPLNREILCAKYHSFTLEDFSDLPIQLTAACYLYGICLCCPEVFDTDTHCDEERLLGENERSYAQEQIKWRQEHPTRYASADLILDERHRTSQRLRAFWLAPVEVLAYLPEFLEKVSLGNDIQSLPSRFVTLTPEKKQDALDSLRETAKKRQEYFKMIHGKTVADRFCFSSLAAVARRDWNEFQRIQTLVIKTVPVTGQTLFQAEEGENRSRRLSLVALALKRKFLLRHNPLSQIDAKFDQLLLDDNAVVTIPGEGMKPIFEHLFTKSHKVVRSLELTRGAALMRKHFSHNSGKSLDEHSLLKEELYFSCFCPQGQHHEKSNLFAGEHGLHDAYCLSEEDQQEEPLLPRLQRALPTPNNSDETNLILFQKDHKVSPGESCFVSPDRFLKRWTRFSQRVLEGFASPFLWVVGGAVVTCLDPFINPAGNDETTGTEFPTSTNRDLDIAFVGLSPLGVLHEIQRLDHFLIEKFTRDKVLTCAGSATLTYVLPYPFCRIQVLTGSWFNIVELLHHTDVDCSGVAFNLNLTKAEIQDSMTTTKSLSSDAQDHDDTHNETPSSKKKKIRVVLTNRSLLSWIYRINVPSSFANEIRGSIAYETRLAKYAKRHGFAVLHVNLTTSSTEAIKLKEMISNGLSATNADSNAFRRKMTFTTGLVWLGMVDAGVFQPKLDAPCILDVSQHRTIDQVREKVSEDGHVESDGYGAVETGYDIVPKCEVEDEKFIQQLVNEYNKSESRLMMMSSDSFFEVNIYPEYFSREGFPKYSHVWNCRLEENPLCEHRAEFSAVGLLPETQKRTILTQQITTQEPKAAEKLLLLTGARCEYLWTRTIGYEHNEREVFEWAAELGKTLDDDEVEQY